MSSQTNDLITYPTLGMLIKDKNLSIDTILNTSIDEIKTWISKVNFKNRKAKHIKEATEMIQNKYGGKVPGDYKEIVALPGVGPKIAHLLLQESFGKIEGISVDTHVHRIANRLGWVKTTDRGKTADSLETWLP